MHCFRPWSWLLLVLGWTALLPGAEHPWYRLSVDGEPCPVRVVRVPEAPPDTARRLASWAGSAGGDAALARVPARPQAREFRLHVADPARLPLTQAVVRPLALGIAPRIDGDDLVFPLAGPAHLVVEVNGSTRDALHLSVTAEPAAAPATAAIVTRFGPGEQVIGDYRVRSGEVIEIDDQAVLTGNLLVRGVEDVVIRGRGILDGGRCPGRKEVEAGQPNRNRFGAFRSLIHIEDSRRVVVDGLALIDSPTWSCQILRSEDVAIRNVQAITWRQNGDGIDAASSTRVRVSDCFVRAWDDALVVKGLASRDYLPRPDGLRRFRREGDLRPCQEVSFERCVVWNDLGHALHIGMETRATAIRGIRFSDIAVIHSHTSDVIGIFAGDEADIEDVVCERVQVEDPHGPRLVVLYAGPNAYTADDRSGSIRRVRISDLAIADTGRPLPYSWFAAGNGTRIEDILLERVSVGGRPVAGAADLDLRIGTPHPLRHPEPLMYPKDRQLSDLVPVEDWSSAVTGVRIMP